MTESEKIQAILKLATGIGENYEDAFPILFELCADPHFMNKAVVNTEGRLAELKIIFQYIAKVQNQICIAEKWLINETMPLKVNTSYIEEYNMYHLSIIFSDLLFIAIVFPGIKRGLVQGINLKNSKASFGRFQIQSAGGVVN